MKKIALINDLSGFGKCSLLVQISVLSALGVETHPLPTAVLSNQSEYDSFAIAELTEYMPAFMAEWQKLGARFDGILTGYFSNEKQVDYALSLVESNGGVLLADPVMGSQGRRYDGFSDSLCSKIAGLCFRADIVTPNVTELQILSGESGIEAGARRLLAAGVKNVVVTGIRENGEIKNAVFSAGCSQIISAPCHGGSYSGTGDIFSALTLGFYINGAGICEAVRRAADFVAMCAENTESKNKNDGVDFEKFIKL
ncbi:MAG: bifunctional hydroxymethylpyrimidine kinase/phosphomethylpyrimidine kinase [Clostridiales bacterium]|nr:bifunctional hydroxymethylpyrimidine kinase/phosphomethylpyrimidine kinase [Clostridiales bacterium]